MVSPEFTAAPLSEEAQQDGVCEADAELIASSRSFQALTLLLAGSLAAESAAEEEAPRRQRKENIVRLSTLSDASR